jgi:hypothetical protein
MHRKDCNYFLCNISIFQPVNQSAQKDISPAYLIHLLSTLPHFSAHTHTLALSFFTHTHTRSLSCVYSPLFSFPHLCALCDSLSLSLSLTCQLSSLPHQKHTISLTHSLTHCQPLPLCERMLTPGVGLRLKDVAAWVSWISPGLLRSIFVVYCMWEILRSFRISACGSHSVYG